MAPVRARSEGLDWSAWRSVVFVSGCAIVFAAGGPPLASIAERHWRMHLVLHIVMMMVAP
jgi:putative membrane protein